MKVLESDVGQQAENFADALHRSLLPDGRVILGTLHVEKMIKKIRTADVLVTPRPDSSIRLDELNKMLNEMKTGEAAIKKLAENDAAQGLVDPSVKRAAEAAFKSRQQAQAQPAASADVLSDRQLAANMLSQAQRMEAEAKGLLAESARLAKEAAALDGVPAETTTAPKRGRPAKAKVADATQG
jgi:hypothetical protein